MLRESYMILKNKNKLDKKAKVVVDWKSKQQQQQQPQPSLGRRLTLKPCPSLSNLKTNVSPEP